MELNIDNKLIKLSFDNGGNLYLSFNDKIFDLNIDINNNIYFDEYKINDINKNINNNDDLYFNSFFFEKRKDEIKEGEEGPYGPYGPDDSDCEPYVKFYTDENKVLCEKIENRENNIALYDTIIYKENTIIAYTELFNTNALYNLVVHNDGINDVTFLLNIIEEKEKHFKLVIDNDNIKLVLMN